MNEKTLVENLVKPMSRKDLIIKYCTGKTVLDIGCINHNNENTYKSNWLHDKIKEVSSSLIGIDLLEEEVKLLNARGYNIITGDVTKRIELDRKFEVIVVGNLIEHLSNFDGLIENINRLLEDSGKVLISTANPFYIEQYFYSAFKNSILINPEHTCWMDPIAMEQLMQRFGFLTEKVFWIKEKWQLAEVIMNNNKYQYDMLTSRWHISNVSGNKHLGMFFLGIEKVLALFDWERYKKVKKRYGSNAMEYIFLKIKMKIFHNFWKLYKIIIIKSSINKYELFISVFKRA